MAGLAGKVALITGGSKGIGKATAIALARAGANVVINYGRDAAAAESLVKDLGSDHAFAVQADASSISGIEKLVKATVEKYSKIDILIANAGILPMKDVEHTTKEDFDKTYALNVKGPYFLVQKAIPHMPPKSHIILNSTTLCASSTVNGAYLLYVSTKGAVEQMVRVLSKDLARAPKNIFVNAIAPGPTGTELFFEGKSEQMLKMIAGANPQNRIGEPEEIADAILFLASDASRWVSGQILRVNGGMA